MIDQHYGAHRKGHNLFAIAFKTFLIAAPLGLWIFTITRIETFQGYIVIFAVGLFAFLFALLIEPVIIKIGGFRSKNSKALTINNVSRALFASLLAAWAAFTVIPEGATVRIENMLSSLLSSQQEIIARLPPPPPATPYVIDNLSGYWGETGCNVVWRFQVEENALKAEIVETMPGLPPYRMLASITSAEGFRLDATGEEPAEARGMAATFIIDNSGAIPRLSWMDRTRDVPLILTPCAEQSR